MAKRRRRPEVYAASPMDMTKFAADSMARSVMDSHPKMKKMRDHISDEVMKAAKRACDHMGKKGK